MQIYVNGEQPFKAQKETFAVAGGAAFTLNYSVDKVNWTAYTEATPANETLIVNGVTYMWFKLAGNTDEKRLIIV